MKITKFQLRQIVKEEIQKLDEYPARRRKVDRKKGRGYPGSGPPPKPDVLMNKLTEPGAKCPGGYREVPYTNHCAREGLSDLEIDSAIAKKQGKQTGNYGGLEEGFDDAGKTMASKLAAGGIAQHSELTRRELVGLFQGLLGRIGEEHQDEVVALADTIVALLPTSAENVEQGHNLEEGAENITLENLKILYDVLVKMSPLLASLAIGTPLLNALLNKLDKTQEINEKES